MSSIKYIQLGEIKLKDRVPARVAIFKLKKVPASAEIVSAEMREKTKGFWPFKKVISTHLDLSIIFHDNNLLETRYISVTYIGDDSYGVPAIVHGMSGTKDKWLGRFTINDASLFTNCVNVWELERRDSIDQDTASEVLRRLESQGIA